MPKKQINIDVDSVLWHNAKVDAVKNNITLQDWLDQAIRAKLEAKRRS